MKKIMIAGLLFGLLGMLIIGCGLVEETPTTTTTTTTPGPTLPKVATPVFLTAPGRYETNTLVVRIECATPGADIYYAIGGAAVSETSPKTAAVFSSGPVTEEVTLRRSDSVRAFAVKDGYQNSDAATATYDLYGWVALNGGLEDDCYALVFTNGYLYAAGSFDYAGGGVPNTSKIARWDGFSWSSIGGPELDVNSYIYSMIRVDNYLYAGGYFNVPLAGVPGANNIARWDLINSTWEALGAGVNGDVNALACDGTYVYVGGGFSDASGVANTQKIARWNIAGQTWEVMAGGIPNGWVEALCLHSGYLYVGGSEIDGFGVLATKNIAKWDIAGEDWEPLGNGLKDDYDYGVQDLYHDGTHLYAGGDFTQADVIGTPLNKIAKWDGMAWSAVGNGSDDYEVQAFAGYGSYIYAGGNFESMSGVPGTLHIARWDKVNSTWEALGAGLVGDEIEALVIDAEGDLYFGGDDIVGDPSVGVGMLNIGKRGKIE